MYIEYFFDREKYYEIRKTDILNLLQMPSDKEVRPCLNCKDICGCELKSQFCCCMCSVDCELAPKKLSSDQENYPIEKNIFPLVYAMFASRVVQPCWSCEGHLDEKGIIGKLPQVWFYSFSVVYPDLISQVLSDTSYKSQLNYSWNVSVSPYNRDQLSTMFTISPKFDWKENADLKRLHDDIMTIESSFKYLLREAAHFQLKKLENQV